MPRTTYSVIRDPVHGDVYLTKEELAILDTPEMQRLRGVRQLGTAYLVFPGATHTRFEHSIGTCHMAGRMIEAIERSRAQAPADCLGVSDEEARLVRIAALLHDVTHIPFGHNIEDQTGLFERHDTPARIEAALSRGLLGERLAALGVLDDVLGILDAGPKRGGVPRCWKQIISDTICADIFDYLKRDAYYTGLQLSYDPRLINYFKIERKSGNLYIEVQKRGFVREDVLSEIVRMLEARYYFSERVYYHHAKIAAGALVAKTVEMAIASGAAREADFHDKTDESLIAFLEGLDYGRDEANRRARGMLARFRSRRLLKRCGVYPLYANRDVQASLLERFFAPGRHNDRRAIERRIETAAAAQLGREVDVMLYCPARHMQLKEARTFVSFPNEGVRPLAEFADRVPRLRDLEESYRNLWKFYALSSEDTPEGIRVLQGILDREIEGATNVYRAGS
jgi:HD superfamily phosphohydrolase